MEAWTRSKNRGVSLRILRRWFCKQNEKNTGLGTNYEGVIEDEGKLVLKGGKTKWRRRKGIT